MVSTVHEQDYYLREGDEYVISGISLAIVLDPRNEDNSRLTTSLDDQIVEEVVSCLRKIRGQSIRDRDRVVKDVRNGREDTGRNGCNEDQLDEEEGEVEGLSR